MTVSDRAVRKASRDRLLRDFVWAARLIRMRLAAYGPYKADEGVLGVASIIGSRTRYAALMTAFGR